MYKKCVIIGTKLQFRLLNKQFDLDDKEEDNKDDIVLKLKLKVKKKVRKNHMIIFLILLNKMMNIMKLILIMNQKLK